MTGIGDRIAALHAAGYGDVLSPSTQVALASDQTTSNQQMLGLAGMFHQALNTAERPFTLLTEDPVLYKQPSLALQVHQAITGTLGWLPVAQPDLVQVQQRLQAMGFGQHLPTDGVWTPDWNSEFQDAGSAHVQQQLAGEGKPLTTTAHKGFMGFLSALLPSHAIPALIGAVKALPGELRDMVAHVAAGIDMALPQYRQHGYNWNVTNNEAIMWNRQARANPEAYQQQVAAQPWYSMLLNDVGSFFSLVPIIGAGTTVAKTGGEAVAKGIFTDLGKEEAMRGPGVIANRLYRPATEEWENATGVFARKPFMSTPILKHMGVPVRAAIGEGGRGWYYQFRTVLAQPMRVPAVQAGLKTVQAVSGAGAADRGLANVESAAAGHQKGVSPLADNVYAQHTIAGPWGVALDLLSGVGRTTLGPSLSEVAGAPFRAADHLANHSLSPLGVVGAFERGTGLDYGKLVADAAKAGIDRSEVDSYLSDKVDSFASARYANEQMRALGDGAPQGTDRANAFAEQARVARQDPDVLKAQRQALLDNLNELTVAFKNDTNRIMGDPREHASAGIVNYLQAKRVATRLFADYGHTLNTPDAREALAATKALGSDAERQAATETPSAFLATQTLNRKPGSWGLAGNETAKAQATMRQAQHFMAQLRRVGLRDSVDTELMKLAQENITSPQIVDAAEKMQGAAKPMLAEEAAAAAEKIRRQAALYLIQHHGIDPLDLQSLDAVKTVAAVFRQAKRTATELHLLPDAPDEAKALVAQLKELGYGPVAGTGIGFEFEPPIVDPATIEGGVSVGRRVLSVLGLNPEHWSTGDAGQMVTTSIERSWQRLINDGKVLAPPGMNAARLLTHVRSQLASELPAAARAFYSLARNNFRAVAEMRVKQGLAKDMEEAFGQVANELARERALRDVSLSKFRDAITKMPDSLRETLDLPEGSPMLAPEHADKLYSAMLNAMAKRPAYIFGLGRVEDAFRSGFGLAGYGATDMPLSRIAARAAAGFNTSVRWRNVWRFGYSPTFSARRVAKTAFKMGVAGATPATRPLNYMLDRGIFKQATEILDRVYPDMAARGAAFDALDLALHDQDIFGIYNPRHFMALAAYDWAKQGKSDAEIKRLIERTFTYGDRTAVERSMGTIFYPFSFERTLYRNVGSYLLDNPGPRLALLAAFDAYNALDSQGHLTKFIERHLPILQELNRLNAFAEGIGPGELGGINRPYFDLFANLFQPQQWKDVSKGTDAVTFLSRVMPVFSDLNRMLLGIKNGKVQGGSLVQQGKVSFWAGANAMQDAYHLAKGDTRFFDPNYRFWHPQHTTLTSQAQTDEAWSQRGLLITKLQAVLDYNYSHGNTKIVWPSKDPIPTDLWGKTVDRTSVTQFVQDRYPDWHPEDVQAAAALRQQQAQTFISELSKSNPSKANEYSTFLTLAQRVQQHMIRGDYTTQRAAALTTEFRQAAVNMAESDSDFLRFYNTFGLRSIFGPLEGLAY